MPPTMQLQQETPHRFPHKGLIFTAALGVVILLGLGGWQWYYQGNVVRSHADFYETLRERNVPFNEAEELSLGGRFSEAVPRYDAALERVGTDEERVQIMLLKSRTLIAAGRVAEAVPLLIEIMNSDAANSKVTVARAAAVTTLAGIVTRGDVVVNRQIFAEEPLKSLWVYGDPGLTLRRMYEYSASIYPTAIALLNISSWYSSRLTDVSTVQEMSGPAISEYVAIIKDTVALADSDIAAMRAGGVMTADLRAALLARAVVLGDLERYGDTSLGDADAAFVDAIQAYGDTHGEDGIARYYYAIFLAQTGGKNKKAEIQELLRPLSSQTYATSFVRPLLQNARTVAFYRQFPVLIANIDPDFKAYLMTIGWTAADFSS